MGDWAYFTFNCQFTVSPPHPTPFCKLMFCNDLESEAAGTRMKLLPTGRPGMRLVHVVTFKLVFAPFLRQESGGQVETTCPQPTVVSPGLPDPKTLSAVPALKATQGTDAPRALPPAGSTCVVSWNSTNSTHFIDEEEEEVGVSKASWDLNSRLGPQRTTTGKGGLSLPLPSRTHQIPGVLGPRRPWGNVWACFGG